MSKKVKYIALLATLLFSFPFAHANAPVVTEDVKLQIDGYVVRGSGVAVDRDTMAVIADSGVQVFVLIDRAWTEQVKIPSVWSDVDLDGDTMVLGRRHEVAVFVRSEGVWSLQAELHHPDGSPVNDWFGTSIALDGDTVLVGDYFDLRLGGADHTSSVFVFTRAAGVWTLQEQLVAEDESSAGYFGKSVALNGHLALIGAPDADESKGAAYVFTRAAGNWNQRIKLVDTLEFDYNFGAYVGIDGSTAVVGDNAGNATAFELSSDGVINQELRTLGNFAAGSKISVSGSTIVTGHGTAGPSIASAHVFSSVSGIWTEKAGLQPSDVDAWGFFGDAVATDGVTVVVAQLIQGSNTTSLYIYDAVEIVSIVNYAPGVSLSARVLNSTQAASPFETVSLRARVTNQPFSTEAVDFQAAGTGFSFDWGTLAYSEIYAPNNPYIVEAVDGLRDVVLAPGQSHEFVVATLAPQNPPVSGGTYTLNSLDFTVQGPLEELVIDTPISITVQVESNDADGDGMPDEWELENGFNPYDPDDAQLDADSEGLINLLEYVNKTDPNVADTDGDAVNDFEEVFQGSDPLDPDSIYSVPDMLPPGDVNFVTGLGDCGEFYRGRPTVVLTHGLSPKDALGDAPDSLWTGLEDDNGGIAHKKAQSLLNKVGGNISFNVVPYVWEDGFKAGGIPDRLDYYRGWRHVKSAGLELANNLVDCLGPDYEESIHFIGHSLGTAVNAYAARDVLRRLGKVKKAQFTALDRPDHIDKIPTPTLLQLSRFIDEFEEDELAAVLIVDGEKFKATFNFPATFFASLLDVTEIRPACAVLQDTSCLDLKIDNYYSRSGLAGVGDRALGRLYNHNADPEVGLDSPHNVGDKLIKEESDFWAFDNDHSGVHQWYRWTISPNDNVFTSEGAGEDYCTDYGNTNEFNIPLSWDVGLFDKESLNPCKAGWYWSINGPDPSDFPSNNGGFLIQDDKLIILTAEHSAGCVLYTPLAGASIFCEEQSSPYIVTTFSMEENADSISFEYWFENVGDGDYAAVHIDNIPVWTMKASAAGDSGYRESGRIPVNVPLGEHRLSIVLHGVNEKNARLYLRKFMVSSAKDDLDGDGVPTERDVCPESNLAETVVIGECDSNVVNVLFGEKTSYAGCTIKDRIGECSAGSKNHGKFVSCVAKLTKGVVSAGLISGREKGKIQSCAAK